MNITIITTTISLSFNILSRSRYLLGWSKWERAKTIGQADYSTTAAQWRCWWLFLSLMVLVIMADIWLLSIEINVYVCMCVCVSTTIDARPSNINAKYTILELRGPMNFPCIFYAVTFILFLLWCFDFSFYFKMDWQCFVQMKKVQRMCFFFFKFNGSNVRFEMHTILNGKRTVDMCFCKYQFSSLTAAAIYQC